MEGFPAAKLQRHFWFDGKWCNGKRYNGKITAAFSTQSFLSSFGYALSKGGNFSEVDSKKKSALEATPALPQRERERTEKENIVW